ncbi:NfeD family protein [Rhodoferax sp. U2-2l]|uniref:NfeD family protein n=1 Tax=Rhodoferax sp. U2-2l TaxID=2884000 RepID=UPI001D0A9D12|nr:NfeD family protein [Rhodoferax sp. U2-2l]MCB8747879.1 NfeD family protein [Rhodoferax sp. U2-2l]
MADSTLWWLAAGALVAAELVTGTFYLLMLAVGLMAAALAAHAGASTTWQWVAAALVGGGSTLLWRAFKRSRPSAAPARANHDVNMDIGETVHVAAFNDDGSCSVHYRGARWDASLAAGEVATGGVYRITEVVGSRLILKKN